MVDNGFALRVAAFFGAVFLVVGSYLPFFPVWLDVKGLSEQEIGFILATPLIVRVLFTPVITVVADRIGDHRLILILLGWGTLFGFCFLHFADGFWEIFVLSAVVAVFWTTILPLSDAVAMSGMRNVGFSYGSVRIWGSITFILASLGGGFVLEWFGPHSALVLLLGAALAVVIGAYCLPRPKGFGRIKSMTVRPAISSDDAWRLAVQPAFVVFLLTTSCLQTSHAVLYGFGSLHWQSLGYSSALIGSFWGIAVVAEIILFMYSRSLFEKIGAARLLLLGGLAGTVRWVLTALDPPIGVLIFCQILHAFTFGAAHLGVMDFVSRSVPPTHIGTAMGIYAAVTGGVAMGVVTIWSGWLYKSYDGAAFYYMGGVSCLGCVGALWLVGVWRGQRLIGETEKAG